MSEKKKFAKQSLARDSYECKKPWPENCFVQCGGNGIVITGESIDESMKDPLGTLATLAGADTKKKHYRTAFFETFPRNPKCFIRGEGATIEEAENEAFEKFEKIVSCQAHEYDRRGREDGYAYCAKCPYSGMVLAPLTSCATCGKPAHYNQDLQNRWYCQEHFYELDVAEVFAASDDAKDSWRETSKTFFLRSKAKQKVLKSAGYALDDIKAQTIQDILLHHFASLRADASVAKIKGEKFSVSTEEIDRFETDEAILHVLILAIQKKRPDLRP